MEINRKYMILEICIILLLIALGIYEGESVIGSLPTVIAVIWSYKRMNYFIGNRASVYYERLLILSVVIMFLKLIPVFFAIGVMWLILYICALVAILSCF